MAEVALFVQDGEVELRATSVRGHERVGEAMTIEVEATTAQPLKPESVVGRGGVVAIRSEIAGRRIQGIVTRLASRATSSAEAVRRYRVTLRSLTAPLGLRRRTFVFQQMSVPDIIKKVLLDAGHPAEGVRVAVQGSHAPRRYVVQYAETDEAFVRRLCEEEGLYFWFEEADANATFVLADTSPSAPKVASDKLSVRDRAALAAEAPCAFDVHQVCRARPGKVTLRDYDPEHPAVKLEGVKEGGTPVEKGVEVYEAPGRFRDEAGGSARAGLRLESLRADASTWRFETNALDVAPGLAVTLEPGPDYAGAADPSGDYFIVGVRHAWSFGESWTITAEAVPIDVPYRLPKVTPRPIIAGVQNAFVTTPPGEEIFVDKAGSVRLHFPWDREGPIDDKSSLPIRVVQPNTPGSMFNPRGGWEVMVAFEDGDPDKPYVLSRVFNGKSVPPYALPANKTVTTLGTYSSPGGQKRNIININDASGAQTMELLAGFGKATTVASNMMTQTVKNEDATVRGSQVRSVGAKETVSVAQAYLSSLGSQSATVGGMQKIFVKGDFTVKVGPETVLVGAACLEKVGNPVNGLKNLATAAALQGVGSLGAVGGYLSTGVSLARAGVAGYQRGGWRGALSGVGMAGAGMAAGALMPGGDALVGMLGSGGTAPWSEGRSGGGETAGGGGASGGSDSAGAAGPGPGHRNTIVAGAYTELIGASCSSTSPGNIGWTTMGASTFLIGGSHSARAGGAVGSRTLGASTETVGSLKIQTAQNLSRGITGAIATTIAGALKSKAGGKHSIKAGGALRLQVSGALKMDGANVTFVCGASKVAASSSGVLIETPSFKVTGATKQPSVEHTT